MMVALTAAGLGVAACGSDGTATPSPVDSDPAAVFQWVELNYGAVTLSSPPFDTLTLTAIPRSASGGAVSTSVRPEFVSRDTFTVRVSPEGRLSALRTGRPVWVLARYTIDGVTLADSAYVVATTATPSVTKLSLVPVAPDSAKVAQGRSKAVRGTLSGTTVSGIAVRYTVADPSVARFGVRGVALGTLTSGTGAITASVRGISIGATTVYASATVAGVTWVDSLAFTVGTPLSAVFYAYAQPNLDGTVTYEFQPKSVRVGVGGSVTWYSLAGAPFGIEFSDPSKALVGGADNMAGNIPQWTLDPTNFASFSRTRQFARPDTITFSSSELKAGGTVVIVDERACLPDCPPFP
jgi:hypothetical protein